ncbi:hypothetical protein OAK15_03605 [Verrucomicrobia bacterium]|nr:hypothetical protein [Verrucomicrobiota bacterium]
MGGAVEQAYYAVAAQFSMISLIVTISVLRIYWKEVAEANEQGKMERVQHLYERVRRILFMIAAIISGFFIPWTKEIIALTLGEAYVDGALVMSLMFVYPIYQSVGQINGIMFYALEMTRPYVVITTVSMVISTITIYFLLAPVDAVLPGLGLGSIGLALKMVVISFFTVNFMMWWLAREKKWNYSIGYQLIGIAIFVPLGFAVYHGTNMAISDSVHVIIRACITGTMYIGLVGLVLYMVPWLIGMNRSELIQRVPNLKQTLLLRDR